VHTGETVAGVLAVVLVGLGCAGIVLAGRACVYVLERVAGAAARRRSSRPVGRAASPEARPNTWPVTEVMA
jgi:hypothetical protein